MPDVERLAARILALPSPEGRDLIALAGPPGSGKSTLARQLVSALETEGKTACAVPMDGFHLDNRVLTASGLLACKGAPSTFDAAGFVRLVRVLKTGAEVVFPVFDRERDLAVSGAGVVPAACDCVVIEGNYLLLDETPWRDLHNLWSLSVYLDPARARLRERLVARWCDQGLGKAEAERRTDHNDMINVARVGGARLRADLVLRGNGR